DPLSLDEIRRRTYVAHPQTEVPLAHRLHLAHHQVNVHLPHAIPAPRKIKARRPRRLHQPQDPFVKPPRPRQVRHVDLQVVDTNSLNLRTHGQSLPELNPKPETRSSKKIRMGKNRSPNDEGAYRAFTTAAS